MFRLLLSKKEKLHKVHCEVCTNSSLWFPLAFSVVAHLLINFSFLRKINFLSRDFVLGNSVVFFSIGIKLIRVSN